MSQSTAATSESQAHGSENTPKPSAAGGRFASLWKGAITRTRYGGPANSLAYFLMRFSLIRRLARPAVRWSRSKLRPELAAETLFPAVDVVDAHRRLCAESYVDGLDLPHEIAREIVEFSNDAECTAGGAYGQQKLVTFSKSEQPRVECERGAAPALGWIRHPGRCEAIRRVVRDPLIYQLGRHYFGYPPKYFEPRLYWSFVTGMDDEQRVRWGQNVMFHYDLHRGHTNYLFFHFYLTDVDAACGPLVVVKGSHRPKSMRSLWASANQSDQSVFDRYGADNIVELLGESGAGFVIDGFCVHRAKPPQARERLVLQIRVA